MVIRILQRIANIGVMLYGEGMKTFKIKEVVLILAVVVVCCGAVYGVVSYLHSKKSNSTPVVKKETVQVSPQNGQSSTATSTVTNGSSSESN